MPQVTINPENYERHDLKSAPPDGFIMLRPLPYGMKLSRRSKATKMMMRSNTPQGKGSRNQNVDQVFELESMDEWAVAHDFAYCVGEHNLQDSQGNLLDFTKPMALKMLDPKVGSEIEKYIDELNNEEGEETLEDFLERSTMSSEGEKNSSSLVGPGATTTQAK